ncbi:MAG: ABC transporter ATP-binding protein [Planctomycetaceae bacterium]|jgi:ABC-2 type transport system ATP-binding protein
MSLLQVRNLHKRYGDFVALHDVSFEVDRGEVLGFLGPNGAGKTTAMMILAGLKTKDGGEVIIDGKHLEEDPVHLKRLMGVVPQELAIYPDLTGEENLGFFGSLYGYSGADLKRRVAEGLARVGLSEFATQYVRAYSGGMKRRLNFAVGVLHEPQLVILDEPTVGVDPQSRSHLLDCVRDLAEKGVGIIYCSHYMEEIEAMCRRVAIFDHGKILAYGPLDELLDRSRRDLELLVQGWTPAMAERLGERVTVAEVRGDSAVVTIPRVDGAAGTNLTQRLSEVIAQVQAGAGQLSQIHTKEYTLERMFLEKTGRRLRD